MTEKDAAILYIMPVHWPRRLCSDSERREATHAGGRPITVPEMMPKRQTKAMAPARLEASGQRVKMRMEAMKVDERWTLRAP